MIRGLSVGVAATILAACSSMGGAVKDYSVDYGASMAQFQNQQIVTNILRARDQTPLHFAELGQVNGSLQEQFQLGATVPFGKYASAAKNSDQLMPQVQFTSSPTFTTSPLDTQAFTVGLMQPIDATYLVDRWRASDLQTRELLLLLFVESIENADVKTVPDGLKGAARLRNTPDGATEFRQYVSRLAGNADFRLVTVLTPIGDPFQIGLSTTTYKLTDVLPLVDEVSIHLRSANGAYQLWRMWSNQLALCYGSPTHERTAQAPTSNPNATSPESQPGQNLLPGNPFEVYFDALIAPKGGSKGNAGSNPGGGPPMPAGNKGGGPGAPAAPVATPVMPLVGFVPYSECFSPIYIPKPKDDNGEREFQVNLRSVRGALEYLGATLKASDATATLQSDDQKRLFSLSKVTKDNKDAVTMVTPYPGGPYAVTDTTSAAVVTILSELIDALKLSSDIATTKQVQIIP